MNGLAFIVGILSIPLTLALLMGDRKVKLIEGKRYRFTTEVKPPLNPLATDGFTKALKDTGAEILTVHNSESATVVTYEFTAMDNKELTLGKPVFTIGDMNAVITNVQEV